VQSAGMTRCSHIPPRYVRRALSVGTAVSLLIPAGVQVPN
jgi:hypothetical protein